MAGRIRTIKPEMLEDAMTAGLSDGAFRLFIGMILLADDAGRMPAAPTFLAGRVFWNAPRTFDERSAKPREVSPIDPERVRGLLAELANAHLIVAYTVRGQHYAQFRNWAKHQRIDKPGPPKYPGPNEATETPPNPDPPRGTVADDSTNVPRNVPDASPIVPGGIGREGKGEEIPPTPRAGGKPRSRGHDPDDPVPEPGTAARAAYDAILAEPNLADAVDRPAAYARELPASFPRVDLAAQIHRAAAWSRDKRRQVRNGRQFLRNWLGNAEPELTLRVIAPHAPEPPKAPAISKPAGKTFAEMTEAERAACRRERGQAS